MDSNKLGAYGTWVGGIATTLSVLWAMYVWFVPKPENTMNNQNSREQINLTSKPNIPTLNKDKVSQIENKSYKPKSNSSHEISKSKNYFSFSGIENTHEKEEIAILILNESDKIEYDLEVKIVDKLSRNGFGATAKFFKNQFISTGLFDKLYDGDRELFRSLNINSHADYIFLGRLSINYRDNDQNLKTSIGKLSGVI